MSTTQDNDTDPSTPGAKRGSEPRPAAGVYAEDAAAPSSPARLKPSTDPGVAPPPEPLSVPRQPMGIVVPAVARSVNDSVEILLEGIDRSQPERPRTAPQSAGQAVASYHAEHTVRAPRPSADDEPKVVIERRVLAQTLRVSREKAGKKKGWTRPAPPKLLPTGARVLIAVVAGLGVVWMIFVALRHAPREAASSTGAFRAASMAASTAAPSVTAAEPLHERSAAQDIAAPVAVAPSVGAPAASTTTSNGIVRKAPSVWRPAKTKLKPLPADNKPTGADLGEFHTSF